MAAGELGWISMTCAAGWSKGLRYIYDMRSRPLLPVPGNSPPRIFAMEDERALAWI
jgi:hypothetical protein